MAAEDLKEFLSYNSSQVSYTIEFRLELSNFITQISFIVCFFKGVLSSGYCLHSNTEEVDDSESSRYYEMAAEDLKEFLSYNSSQVSYTIEFRLELSNFITKISFIVCFFLKETVDSRSYHVITAKILNCMKLSRRCGWNKSTSLANKLIVESFRECSLLTSARQTTRIEYAEQII